MEIKLRYSDLIERMVWDKYRYFILDGMTKEEVDELIQKNEEFIINEKDAYVIGLLNTLYTEEVVYKYKQHLREIIENKSFNYDDVDNKVRKYITRKILLTNANKFKNKIPSSYTSKNNEFNKQKDMLIDVNNFFIEEVKKLEYTIIQDWPCVKYGQVKKIINRINSYDF